MSSFWIHGDGVLLSMHMCLHMSGWGNGAAAAGGWCGAVMSAQTAFLTPLV